MHDAQGRTIRYLRLSVTPACSMRCAYCRPAADGGGASEMMSVGEIRALVGHLTRNHGLRKVRLTGGEPTARPDLLDIVRSLTSLQKPPTVVLTTNGLTLHRQARELADAGLHRVNISLDSLDRANFRRITGIDALDLALRGIDAALAAGLTPVKLNCVVLRGHNDHELGDLVRFAARRGVEIRFIELMPMGPLAGRWQDRFVSEGEMRRRLEGTVATWQPLAIGSEAARRHRVTLDEGGACTIGFITPMSCPFCDACDRIRIGADGTLYPCLMDRPSGGVLEALRPALDPERLDAILARGLAGKAPEHPAAGVGVMTRIGG